MSIRNTRLKTLSIAVIAIMAILGLVVFGISYYTLYLQNTASVAAQAKIGIFLDAGYTSELTNGTTIDWGTVNLGSNTKTYWIKNTGNCDVTLSLTTSTMPSGWTLSWDYDDSVITPGGGRKVIITLTVPNGAPAGTYSWDSWVSAVES